MSDKEILVKSFEQYVKNLASSLFGFNSIPTQAVINYIIRNIDDKYGYILDIFTDKAGNINIDILGEAVMEEIKRHNGFKIANIKFTDKDIKELIDIFKSNKSK